MCPNGYLCAFVRTGAGYYKFDFTRCGTRYRVSGWHGSGWIANAQWGGVTARFYGRGGGLLATRRDRADLADQLGAGLESSGLLTSVPCPGMRLRVAGAPS